MGKASEEPLVEQIISEMFALITSRKEFDAKLTKKLKNLAKRGELKKSAEIFDTIKVASEESK